MAEFETGYNPEVLDGYAEKIYNRATTIVRDSVIKYAVSAFLIGGLIGWAIPSAKTSELLNSQTVIAACIGGMVGALYGYLLAQDAALQLKAQAELILCQMQVEVNTRTVYSIGQQVSRTETNVVSQRTKVETHNSSSDSPAPSVAISQVLRTGKIKYAMAYLFSEPNLRSKPLASINREMLLNIKENHGDWLLAEAEGQQGFIQSSMIDFIDQVM